MKKTLSTILVLALIAAMLTGCAGVGPAAPASAGDNAAPAAAPAPAGDSAPTPADNSVYELNVSLTHGEGPGAALVAALKGLEQESGGRLKFNFYFSNSLVTIPEVPKAIATGVADITNLALNNYPSQFPLNAQILGLPFLGIPDMDVAARIYDQLLDEFSSMVDEFTAAGMTILNLYSYAPYQMHLAKTDEVRLPEDLRGLKIINPNVEFSSVISGVGGAPIIQPPTEYYSSLEKGVADGVINHFPAVVAFGVTPALTKQHIIFGEQGVFFNYTVNVIRTETLNKLPEYLKQLLFDAVADWQAAEIAGVKQMEVDAIAGSKEAGNLFTELSEAEIEAWKALAVPYQQSTVDSLMEQGYADAQAIYSRALALMAE